MAQLIGKTRDTAAESNPSSDNPPSQMWKEEEVEQAINTGRQEKTKWERRWNKKARGHSNQQSLIRV